MKNILKMLFGGDFQSGVYAEGGSLEAHGINVGDTFLKTMSGVIQKVKDKNGNIVYVNLATGERKSQLPLPFDDGGEVMYFINKDGIKVRSKVEPKEKLSEKEWMAKHNDSKESRTYGFGGLFGKAKEIVKPTKYPQLEGKQVVLKSGEYVQVLTQDESSLMVLELNKIGTGVKPRKVTIYDVDMTSFANGGALIGNQKRIDMNKNGKIDAEDFKLLRSSMNGAWRNERKHVNHNEDYEVRYAKKKPARTGYKGKRNFATGGGVSFGGKNPKIEKYSVYIEYGNDDDNEMKVVELDFPNLQQASNFYKKYSNSNKYKGQDILDMMILKYYENGDFEQIENNYSKGGYVEITDPKRELFDKGYAIYGGDAWEKFEDVKKIPLPKGAFIVKVKTNNNNYFAIAEKRKMAIGGGVSKFKMLSDKVAKNYVGKRVKPQYQKEYGKVYSKSEAKEVGNKVAGKVKAMQKAESGTQVKKGGQGAIMILAKKIRKDGEKWTDAVKRAGQQLK